MRVRLPPWGPNNMIKIQNPNIKIKPECYNCGYLNNNKLNFYKCKVPGTCPAIPIIKTKKQINNN